MKIAVVGSRGLFLTEDILSAHLSEADEVVSGGAKGVDTCAAKYAQTHTIKLTEILPDYKRFGRAAPIIRNKAIVDYADRVIAFWDGNSKGTLSVIKYAEKLNKPCAIVFAEKT